MYSKNDLAKRYGGVSRQSIDRWVKEELLPKPIMVGCHARWTELMIAEAEKEPAGILAELARPLIHQEKEQEEEEARRETEARKTELEKEVETLEEEIERLKYWQATVCDMLGLPPDKKTIVYVFAELSKLKNSSTGPKADADTPPPAG